MSNQFSNEILNALIEASVIAERVGDHRLADQSDILAQRVAQLSQIKEVAKPVLKYLGNDQIMPAGMDVAKGGWNLATGKGFGNKPLENTLTDTPVTMLGVGNGNYIQNYLSSPTAWLADALPATSKMRFMNMIRSELISSGFTELTDNRVWRAFSEQKGQHGLETLVRDFSKQADKILGPVKTVSDAETRIGYISQWIKNFPSNRITGLRQFFVRNFGSLVPSKGGFSLANERAQRATEYIKNKAGGADDALSTDDLIKKYRLNLDDHGFDRSTLNSKTQPSKTLALKGLNQATGKVSSATDLVQSVIENIKNNSASMQNILARVGGTEKGAKWIRLLKGTKDSSKIAKGLKIISKIAVVIAVADVIGSLPAAARGDARAQTDVAINTAGLVFPPLAIANALTSLFGLDLSDMLVTNAEALGESASGVDTAAMREDLINAGMTYNPQTKEWEGGSRSLSRNLESGKSFESEMMSLVKSGISINQAWFMTRKKMRASGATPEEILAVRQKYNQAKTSIYNDGMIGAIKAPMWTPAQIEKFEDSLNKHVLARLKSGVPVDDLMKEIDAYMRKVPNLRMISEIRSRIVDKMNSYRGNSDSEKTPSAQKQNNSLMSTALSSRGPRVAAWQKFLAQNGFFENYSSKTPPIFGPRTSLATKSFQSKYNLRIDGVVGPETLGKARQLGAKL